MTTCLSQRLAADEDKPPEFHEQLVFDSTFSTWLLCQVALLNTRQDCQVHKIPPASSKTGHFDFELSQDYINKRHYANNLWTSFNNLHLYDRYQKTLQLPETNIYLWVKTLTSFKHLWTNSKYYITATVCCRQMGTRASIQNIYSKLLAT